MVRPLDPLDDHMDCLVCVDWRRGCVRRRGDSRELPKETISRGRTGTRMPATISMIPTNCMKPVALKGTIRKNTGFS
jgi:hypothetical protein